MLDFTRRVVRIPAARVEALPAVSAEAVFSAVAVGGALALLVQDRIHPIVVYCLQLFLST